MSLDITEIVTNWEKDEPRFKELGSLLLKKLRNDIYELEISPQISYRIKDLLSIIRKIKKKDPSKAYSYDDLKDKLGIRIICNFSSELDLIETYLNDNFIVLKPDKKKEQLDFNKLDYISNHYDLTINPANDKWKHLISFNDLTFEVQVKTLNQHTWSNTSHALSYKQEISLSDSLKRKIFRLLSLYEIADDEFLSVYNTLNANSDNYVYSLLRKTEGKIYKFAKTDFDRDTSLYVLKKLVEYFNDAELVSLQKNIEDFIKKHEDKIKIIFDENRMRFHEIPFITQPEIFVIWYALENFSFSVTDNWENDFDLEELEQIETLWGRDIVS